MNSVTPVRRPAPPARWFARTAAVLVLALGLGMLSAPAAYAADAALTVTKTVDGLESATVDPGDEFTYAITVGCDDADCEAAQLVDELPAAFVGFPILSASVTPPTQPTTTTLNGCSTVVTASCSVTVDFDTMLDTVTTGIRAGDTHILTVRLRAPLTLSPSWAFNGTAVPNTAQVTSTTAPTVSDTANVTIGIPVTVNVTPGKAWSPATQQYAPGVQSTVTLSLRNTSNVAAESLVLQDPKVADAAAVSLAASNPFSIVDFVSFGSVTAPQGADRVTVDAYVFDGLTWGWVAGSPSTIASIGLPGGVVAADVAGLRFSFTDAAGAATITESGTAGAVQLTVAQRAAYRESGSTLALGATATNQVSATVVVPGQTPVSRDASAPYTIAGLSIDVSAGKTITPSRIPAGTNARALVTGKNDSNGPLSSLTLGDTGFFTADLAFGGFLAPVAYPAGATGASVMWHFSDASVLQAPFADGSTPTMPAAPVGQHLTGFEVTYTGAIAAASVAAVEFAISPSVAFVPTMGVSPKLVDNTATVRGTNAAGSDSATAVAPLRVFFPAIALTIDKSVNPTGAVNPGGTVVVQLPTTTGTDSAFVKPTEVVVHDVWRTADADDFWNAFSPVAIAPTQVIAGSSLLIEYTVDGSTWLTLDTVPATSATVVYSKSIDPAVASTITGLRYTFANPAGLAQGTTVSPNTVFAARSTLRAGGAATSVVDAPASVYENRGFAEATGVVAGGSVITSAEVADVAEARILTTSGTGGVLADKEWTTASVVSQSGAAATTRLGWAVSTAGSTRVTVTDPAAGLETTPENTVFQAFDLTRIAAITFAQDPLLRWDRVVAVELYVAGSWVSAGPVGTNWMNANGFTGYTLTPQQSAAATGVRLVVEPNDTARATSSNPLAPPAGSGVASSAAGSARPVDLVWSLRNVARVGGTWVGEDTFPSVTNTVGVTVGGAETTASDAIALVDFAPAVSVTKTSTVPGVTIPHLGDVAAADYPSIGYTVTATNDSASRASYLRVSDPMPCTESTVSSCITAPGDWAGDPYASAVYDPATNPFERVDLTALAFTVPAGQVSKNASLVTLWKRDATGALTREVVTITAAEALAAPALADVVGISVVYQNANASTAGGSIVSGAQLTMTVSSKLRVFQRSAPTTLVAPATVGNHVDAQSYDPVLFPSGTGSTPHDSALADVALVTGRLDAVATKVITPATILQRDRTSTVNVALGATDGTATAPANTVTITDVDADFWDRFRLTGLGATALPAGADRVSVDVQLNGAAAWVPGPVGATAVLPAVALDQVTGIRFTFSRADGALLSRSAPAADWSASASLRVVLLETTRDAGAPIAFPSTVDNRVDVTSSRTDRVFAAATDDATDDLGLATGSWQLDVEKTPAGNAHTVYPGTLVPWTMSFSNTGTGYLTIADLTDQLPSHLSFDFENPVYSTSAGGKLSTDVSYAYDEATKRLSFAWPSGANLMAPGEKFTITLGLTLEPGLQVNDRATNEMIVTTVQPLAACTNNSGNGQATLPGLAVTECGTTNFVQPTPGASLATYKGVKGDVDSALVSGAVNTATPGGPCLVDSEGYYRAPCAANSAIGSTDEWKLLAVNSGTESYRSLTLVDPLPRLGDRMLATGGNRGSTFQPVFDGDFGVALSGAPAGSTASWQVTTDPGACIGTATSTWNSDPNCTANAWVAGSAYTGDWAAVTALRVTVDFSTSATGLLAPAGSFKVVYQSINLPETPAAPGGAPVDAPLAAQYAWNQFGAQAVLESGTTLQRAPVKVGVRLVESALAVSKTVTGAAAALAPTSFRVDLACTVAGVALDLGARSALALTSGNGLTARVDHLPLGSVCAVTEHGTVGEFGETSRSVTPGTVALLVPTDTATPVAAAQLATVVNNYDFASLSITKRIDTLATVGGFGSFDFSLACTTPLGDPVALDPADAAFTLVGGATRTVAASSIPVGSECEIAETTAGAADAVAITGAGVVDGGNGTATITVGAAAVVTVANTFEAGTLAVVKTVTGAGGAAYGDGPFAASVSCVYGTTIVYADPALPIVAGIATSVPEVFPVGTVCAVAESTTGGATSVGNPAAVTITGPTGGASLGAVTADITNHFDLGRLDISKERVGDGVAKFGTGPFEVTVVCTWVKDGARLTVPLVDGGVLTLSDDNGYAATIAGIIVGAECVVEETDAGLATATSMIPADGTVTIVDPATTPAAALVRITNVFDVGQLSIDKTADAERVAASGTVVYTVTVRNIGQIAAEDVAVTDTLPAAAHLVSTSPAATVNDGVLGWVQPRLAAGETATFTVTVRYFDAGTHVNTASLVNPVGPWNAPIVAHPCEGDPGAACAAVAVMTLALTGGELTAGLLWLALASIAAGLVLIARRRRVAR